LEFPSQVGVNFESNELLGSRCQKLGHRPAPCANLADQIGGLNRQGLDNAPLKPPVAEKVLAKLGTGALEHGRRLYLNV
jgi:hypothetical protein